MTVAFGIRSRFGAVMKLNDFDSLSIDELCVFREEVVTALAAKMVAERSVLENRLRQLRAGLACLNKISASISGASAGFRPPSGVAAS